VPAAAQLHCESPVYSRFESSELQDGMAEKHRKGRKRMIALRRILLRVGAAVAVLVLLASCATINRLDRYVIENASLRTEMRVPPPPTLNIGYSTPVDSGDPIGKALRIGTTIIKASEAAKAEPIMREALRSVDVPAIVLEETSQACASVLNARPLDRGQKADYLLDLDIYEYGIEAPSWSSSVSLHLGMTAIMYHNSSGEIVWRRKHITVDIPASPQMFGLGSAMGDIVSAGVLSSLRVDQLEEGFRRLALESARWVTRILEDDLYRARYR
jgi:hypothetical protein